jgi:hypothetical protein
MAFRDMPPDTSLQFVDRPRRRSSPEQRSMNVLRGVTAGFTHDDVTAFVMPFQDGSRTDAEPLSDFGRNRDLTLRGELRMRQRHDEYYHGNESTGHRQAGLKARL